MKTHQLKYTKEYLLLIDEEAEIKEGDTVYENISGVFAPYEKEDIVENPIKIFAYYPLSKEAKELDLLLLPNPFEKGIDETTLFKNLGHECFIKMKELNPSGGIKEFIRIAVEFGYKAAQSSNKQFSLEDMKKAFRAGQKHGEDNACSAEIDLSPSEEDYIRTLSTQQLPKEFIVTYERVRDWDSRDINGDYNSKLQLKTITNSEGKEEIVGTYIN